MPATRRTHAATQRVLSETFWNASAHLIECTGLMACHLRKVSLKKLEEAEPRVPVLHPNLEVPYRRKVAELTFVLGHPQDRDETVTIIRSFIDDFVVGSTMKGFRVEFVGKIPNMIKIPHGNTAMNIEKC